MEIYIIIWLLWAVVGAIIGNAKARPAAGAILGLLLGPIGWLLMMVALDNRPKCPECGGRAVQGARKCIHCGSILACSKPSKKDRTDSTNLAKTEQLAFQGLVEARNYLKAGKKEVAVHVLKDIIEKYPDTDAAAKAKEILK
ncbi:MAG: hypothetical protein ABL888_10585 [Pirellulaceae bacterium]